MRGVTLPELVALLVACGAVIAVAVSRDSGPSPAGRHEIAKARLETIREGIEQWRRLASNDTDLPPLPGTLDELRTGPPDYPRRWRSIVGGAAIPADPWGHSFRYQVINHQTASWRATCAGPDGRFDTDDDLRTPATPD